MLSLPDAFVILTGLAMGAGLVVMVVTVSSGLAAREGARP